MLSSREETVESPTSSREDIDGGRSLRKMSTLSKFSRTMSRLRSSKRRSTIDMTGAQDQGPTLGRSKSAAVSTTRNTQPSSSSVPITPNYINTGLASRLLRGNGAVDLVSIAGQGVLGLIGELNRADTAEGQQLEDRLGNEVHRRRQEFIHAGLPSVEQDIQALHALLESGNNSGGGGGGGGGGRVTELMLDLEAGTWHDEDDDSKVEDDTTMAIIAVQGVEDAISSGDIGRAVDKLLQVAASPETSMIHDSVHAVLDKSVDTVIAALTRQITAPTSSRRRICNNTILLSKVAGPYHAQQVLLYAHSQRLRRGQNMLLHPAISGGCDEDILDYAAALGANLAVGLSEAATDWKTSTLPRQEVEEEEDKVAMQAMEAVFLSWAVGETEAACQLLQTRALTTFAVPAGMTATTRCVLAFLAQVSALSSQGLQLSPVIHAAVATDIHTVVSKHMRRVSHALSKSVKSEVAALISLPDDTANNGNNNNNQGYPSATFMVEQLELMARDLAPLATPRILASIRKGVSSIFSAYTLSLVEELTIQAKLSLTSSSSGHKSRLKYAREMCVDTCTALVDTYIGEALAPLQEIGWGNACDGGHLRQSLKQLKIKLQQ